MRRHREMQQELHDALERILLEEGEIISTWAVCYEAVAGDSAAFGYVHGPRGTLPWRSRGMHAQVIAYMDGEMAAMDLAYHADPTLFDQDAEDEEHDDPQ